LSAAGPLYNVGLPPPKIFCCSVQYIQFPLFNAFFVV
jgi:hypothetical protein